MQGWQAWASMPRRWIQLLVPHLPALWTACFAIACLRFLINESKLIAASRPIVSQGWKLIAVTSFKHLLMTMLSPFDCLWPEKLYWLKNAFPLNKQNTLVCRPFCVNWTPVRVLSEEEPRLRRCCHGIGSWQACGAWSSWLRINKGGPSWLWVEPHLGWWAWPSCSLQQLLLPGYCLELLPWGSLVTKSDLRVGN